MGSRLPEPQASEPPPSPSHPPQPQQSGPSQPEAPAPGSRAALVHDLALASREFDATGPEPERNCWLVVHRHVHGVLPSEYDIREIPEDLYLEVLEQRRQLERRL